jgi:tetratricopeptide (TPR) repeat protein
MPHGADELSASGDEFFRMGNFPEAARDYALASDADVHSPEILFNLGNALYRENLYAEASIDFQKAAALSHDPRFRAKCKLAQANCAYRTVRGLDAFALAKELGEVLAQYREAWSEDPSLTDAPHNIEIVKRKLDALRSQLRASSRDFMAQSLADVERGAHNDADDILKEDRPGGRRPPVDRRIVNRDW